MTVVSVCDKVQFPRLGSESASGSSSHCEFIGVATVEPYEIERSMAIDVDWLARLRTAPCEACPSEGDLRAFVLQPEEVDAAAFSHIIRGCDTCRAKLQEIVLHPSVESLQQYLRDPSLLREETLLHCMDCEICQLRARELLQG